MNQTIEERMQSIEDQLKEIRKELEESLFRYKNPVHSWKDIQAEWGRSNKCLFDNLPPEDRYKPMCMSCPCPKCSPYC